MDSRLPETEADSLAGLIVDFLGRLPEPKEVITIADMKITVLKLAGTRLERLMLERVIPPTDGTEPGSR